MKIYVVMYNLFSSDESEVFRIFDSAWKKEEDARKYCDRENGNNTYNPDVEYSHFYKEVELNDRQDDTRTTSRIQTSVKRGG